MQKVENLHELSKTLENHYSELPKNDLYRGYVRSYTGDSSTLNKNLINFHKRKIVIMDGLYLQDI